MSWRIYGRRARELVESKISPEREEEKRRLFIARTSCYRLLTPGRTSMTEATRIGKGVDANSTLH